MKKLTRRALPVAVALILVAALLAGCRREVSPSPQVIERIGIDSYDDCYLWNGADLYAYSDDHSTQKFHIDGATGNLEVNGSADIDTDLDVDGTTNLDTVDIDDLVNITRVTGTTGQYEDLILAEWTNSAADASFGSNGIYMSTNPIYDVNNVYGLRSRLDLRGATGAVDVNQLHAIDGLINLNETQVYTLTDNISAVGVAIHGGTSGDVIGDAAADPGSLNLYYGVYGPTATVNHTIQTNGMLLMMHDGTHVDYGVQIQSSADMDAGLYLNSHTSNAGAKMDVGVEMVSGASDMVYGIDMSAADFTGADIVLDEGATIANTQNNVITFTVTSANFTGHINALMDLQDKAANYSITTAETGALFTNDGASVITFTLPAPAVGLMYGFIAQDDQDLLVNPNASETILNCAAAGNSCNLDAQYDTMWIVSDGTDWLIYSVIGTLADAGY